MTTTPTDKLVIGLAGMPGSGKSLIVNTAKQLGYAIITMGDIVRQETANKGLEPTPENIGKTMLELRHKEGESIIAKRCIPKIEKTSQNKVIVDGIRSLSEAEEFKRHYPRFTLIAVHASPETRFKRLYRRQRSDDSPDWKTFQERDTRELNVGLGNAISMAEHIIINEETPDTAITKTREALRKVEAKWTK